MDKTKIDQYLVYAFWLNPEKHLSITDVILSASVNDSQLQNNTKIYHICKIDSHFVAF